MSSKPQALRKKTTIVRDHPRRVPVSRKNPAGITIVDQHSRRVRGPSLDGAAIRAITKTHLRTGLTYPTPGRLQQYKNADKYDDLIAVWTEYFNKALQAEPSLEPDLIKALIASESGFDAAPKTRVALGISQITKETLSALQDPDGETKEFTFKKIRQKDLKDPSIAIPLAIRWLIRKQRTAANRLGRKPSPEEVILEYKGLLKSTTIYKERALANFRKHYAALRSK